MKLEQIQEWWTKDCILDETEVSREASIIPQLHNKYLKLHTIERLALLKLQEDLKRLRFEKMEFYRDGPNDETRARGWEFPPRGRLAPGLAATYVDADKDVIAMNLQVGFQSEKVSVLHEIIKSLNNRNYLLTNILADRKWSQGS